MRRDGLAGCGRSNRMINRVLILAVAAGLVLVQPGWAGPREDSLADRPGVGAPVRMLSETGGAFRPERLVIRAPDGTASARMPRTSDAARSEDRIDLGEVPLVGPVFRDRLAPSDAAKGLAVGPVFRQGGVLTLESALPLAEITSRPVVLTSRLPRDGTVSFRLAPLSFATDRATAPPGREIAMAYLLEGRLVIASTVSRDPPGLRELFGL